MDIANLYIQLQLNSRGGSCTYNPANFCVRFIMHTSTMLSSSLAGSTLPLRPMQKNFRSVRSSALVCRAAKKDADEELQTMPKVLAVPMVAAFAGKLLSALLSQNSCSACVHANTHRALCWTSSVT